MNIDKNQMEDFVKNLGVFELRALARQFGVKSPTTKKREELLNLINEAIKGGKKPDLSSDPKRGRPFKKLNSIEDISSKINDYDNIPIPSVDNNEMLVFEQDSKLLFPLEDEVFVMEGIIYETDLLKGFRDLKSGETVILSELIKIYDTLKPGDKVKVEARKMRPDDSFITNKILEINGVKTENYNTIKINEGEDFIDDRTIPFGVGLVKIGRRNLLQLSDDVYEHESFDEFYKFCKNNGFEFVVLGTETSIENKIKFSNLKIENDFTSMYGAEPQESYEKISDGLNFAIRQREIGKKVLVFVTDILDALRCLDRYYGIEEGQEHSSKSIQLIQKLINFAKSNTNNSSGTLIMCYRDLDADDQFLRYNIIKISKKLVI